MDISIITTIIIAAVAIAAIAVILGVRLSGYRKEAHSNEMRIRELEKDIEYRDTELSKADEAYRRQQEDFRKALTESKAEAERRMDELKSASEKRLAEQREESGRRMEELKSDAQKRIVAIKEESAESLKQQIAAVKAQILEESEKVLKARQEEFSKTARESFSTIAGDVNKSLTDMKQAFEANKTTQAETSSVLRTHIDEAVRHLKDQTESIGQKADHLASALRGQSKMQGCWGETQLGNILNSEGLVEGRDYDREETLRDDMGIVIHNEDTGKRMRPDFILHYPDNTDIVVDCKVSLNALSDYMSAESEQERKDAAERNLKAVNDQVENLARKDYGSYLKTGHKFLDYTVMFVPNVNALVLARQLDPLIVAKAYKKGVLITSEETFVPFLNLVRRAWVNFDQARNQEKIIQAAERMVDRVADFCNAYATIGKKLKEAQDAYDKGGSKIAESGASILRSAHDVVALGVKCKKTLPPVEGILLSGAEASDAAETSQDN